MRPLGIFTLWLIVGLVTTGLVAGTLQRVAADAEAGEQTAAYTPPKAPPTSFLGTMPVSADRR